MARKIVKYTELPTEKDIRELKVALLMEDGKEYGSNEELSVTAEEAPKTLREQVERIIGSYLYQHSIQKQGLETIDEFNDFDTGEAGLDDYEPTMEEEFFPSVVPDVSETPDDMRTESEPSEQPE